VNAAARSVSPGAGLEAQLKDTTLPSGTDHSIAAFFLQLASATMNGPDPLPQSAAVILDDVLPSYFAVVKK
jgi:hypothetical protein